MNPAAVVSLAVCSFSASTMTRIKASVPLGRTSTDSYSETQLAFGNFRLNRFDDRALLSIGTLITLGIGSLLRWRGLHYFAFFA